MHMQNLSEEYHHAKASGDRGLEIRDSALGTRENAEG
jgi:hypothetical protein